MAAGVSAGRRVLVKNQSRARKQALCGIALPVLLLFALAGEAVPQTRPSPEKPAPYQISVNVNLVVLDATVRDQKGRPASDLS